MKRLLATPICGSDGTLTTPFRELCLLTGLDKLGPIDDIGMVHTLLQRYWYQDGVAAGAIVEKHAELIPKMTPLFHDLQLLGEVLPPVQRYDTVFLLGATYTAVHKRIALLARLYDMGIRWNIAVFTANRRKRWDGSEGTPNDKENDDVIVKPVEGGLPFITGWQRPDVLPKNEGEIVDYVLGQVAHEALSHARTVSVTENEKAGTRLTLETWARESRPSAREKLGLGLLVGSQPHVLRSRIEGIAALGPHFDAIEACGYDMASAVRGTYTLDELAKLVDTLLKTAA